MAKRLEVTFKSLGRSAREWTVLFDCGSDDENRLQALRHAWKMRASIAAERPV